MASEQDNVCCRKGNISIALSMHTWLTVLEFETIRFVSIRMSTNYKVKIARDWRHHYSYTVVTPDRKIAVREGGFFQRDATVTQAQAAILDLKAFHEAEVISHN
jgi:hypothetical protein